MSCPDPDPNAYEVIALVREAERLGYKLVRRTEATPQYPVYRKVLQGKSDFATEATPLYFIECDEGWRSVIVCEGMYENVADWLLGILGHRPYAP